MLLINKLHSENIKGILVFSLLLYFSTMMLSLQAADAPVIKTQSITNAVAGTSSVLIPVQVTGFNNIGQFTLTMKFDTTKVRFIAATSNPLLAGMTINYFSPVGNTQGKLVFSWTGNSNLNLVDGSSLANLTFSYINSTGILSWAYTYGAVCQYKTFTAGVLTPLNDNPKYLFYLNGGISNRSAPLTYAAVIASPSLGTIALPVKVNKFTNIGALTLYLEYDTTVISYQNIFTKNPVFNSSFLVGNIAGTGSNKILVIQWYSSSAISLADSSTLCTFNFTYLPVGNSTSLTWNDNGPSCEYADGNGNVLIDMPKTDFYYNGQIGNGIKIKGQLLYDNTYNTPLNGVTVKLVNSSNQVVATTTTALYTDNSIPNNTIVKGGYYEFLNVNPGNYTLRSSSTMYWGGVNSTDALYILRHTVGIDYLTGLSTSAADVNLSHYINSTDALILQLRSIGNINQFPSGDWVFGDTTVTVYGVTVHNIKALAAGDVNRSYIPSGSKSEIYRNFKKEGVVYTAINQEVDLPVRVNDFIRLAALSLDISFNNKIIDVTGLTSELKDLKFRVNKGKIQIAWADINDVYLQANDILFTLKVKMISEKKSVEDLFTYNSLAEFADRNGHIINVNSLKISDIEVNNRNDEIRIFPNPFKEILSIELELVEPSFVSVTCYNVFGQKTRLIENQFRMSGNNILNLNTSDLRLGVYSCEIITYGGSIINNKVFKIVKNN